jgi:hypothetical protein
VEINEGRKEEGLVIDSRDFRVRCINDEEQKGKGSLRSLGKSTCVWMGEL